MGTGWSDAPDARRRTTAVRHARNRTGRTDTSGSAERCGHGDSGLGTEAVAADAVD